MAVRTAGAPPEHSTIRLDSSGRYSNVEPTAAESVPSCRAERGPIQRREIADPDDREDELRVHHWKPQGLTLAYSVAVPGGIDAVAACPLEDTGASLLVVASGSELWFVR